jgi:hypothetical protein
MRRHSFVHSSPRQTASRHRRVECRTPVSDAFTGCGPSSLIAFDCSSTIALGHSLRVASAALWMSFALARRCWCGTSKTRMWPERASGRNERDKATLGLDECRRRRFHEQGVIEEGLKFVSAASYRLLTCWVR